MCVLVFISTYIELHVSRLIEDSTKKAKERAKTVIVGDMQPLLSALPTVKVPILAKDPTSEKPVR